MIALALALFLAGAQASAQYRIGGTVLNAADGQPVAGARVTLAPLGRPNSQISTFSGDDGRFSFSNLPEARFRLAAERRGLLPEASPAPIATGPGKNSDIIVLRLPPPAGISGKVVDDAGDPVANARVELTLAELDVDLSRTTDDIGEYRFSGLPPGSYYLAVSAVPWYTKFNETMGESAPRAMTHAGYAIRYYPNTSEPAAAEPLSLRPGQDAVANFTMIPVPAVSVQVHCDQFEDSPKQYSLTAPGLAGNHVNVRQGSASGDLYNFWGVPPGHYTLNAEASDTHQTWYGVAEVDAAADIEVNVTLRPAPSLSGIVALDTAGSLPDRLTLRLRAETGRAYSLSIAPDGRFSTPAIPPGRYRLSLAGSRDYDLKSWSALGATRDGEILDIPAGTTRVTVHAVAALK